MLVCLYKHRVEKLLLCESAAEASSLLTMSAQVQGQPASPTRLRARLRAAQVAAAAITTECASSSARVGKRVREDNEAAEPAPSTESSKRPATNRRRRASSDGDDERRRRLSSADYSEDVDEVDERIDYVEDVEDEEEEGTTPAPRRKRPARRETGDASALDSKSSLANRFSRIKY